MQRLAASSAASSSFSLGALPLHHCSTSCTDRLCALGSQPCTMLSRRDRRLSWSGCGCGQWVSASLRVFSRSSILPRRKAHREQLAQRGLERTKLVGQAKAEVEKTTVDGT